MTVTIKSQAVKLIISRGGPEIWIVQTRPNFGCLLIIKYLKNNIKKKSKSFLLQNIKVTL